MILSCCTVYSFHCLACQLYTIHENMSPGRFFLSNFYKHPQKLVLPSLLRISSFGLRMSHFIDPINSPRHNNFMLTFIFINKSIIVFPNWLCIQIAIEPTLNLLHHHCFNILSYRILHS